MMSKAITTLLCLCVSASASNFLGLARVPSSRIIAHGDSITLGVDASLPYINTVALLEQPSLSAPWVVDFANAGISAVGFNFGTSNLIATAASIVDARRISGRDNKLIVFAGTNDIWLGGSTTNQTYGYFTNYLAARIDAGWAASNIWVCAMLPRESNSEVVRTNYNTLLRNGADVFGYNFVRLDTNSMVGLPGCQSNTTYYAANQIHPNTLGQSVIASNIFNVMYQQ